MAHTALLSALLAVLWVAGSQSTTATKVTLKNNCPYPIWPGALEEMGSVPLIPTASELPEGASKTLIARKEYSAAVWARTHCANDSHGTFKCLTGDCGTGVADCEGAKPPLDVANVVILHLGHHGNDSYVMLLNDGFNVPVSVVPSERVSGRRRRPKPQCRPMACPVDLNSRCPKELAVVADGRIIACKSPCLAFNTPETCCTGKYDNVDDCRPTKYLHYFEENCPEGNALEYIEGSKIEECKATESYVITFCP